MVGAIAASESKSIVLVNASVGVEASCWLHRFMWFLFPFADIMIPTFLVAFGQMENVFLYCFLFHLRTI